MTKSRAERIDNWGHNHHLPRFIQWALCDWLDLRVGIGFRHLVREHLTRSHHKR